MACLFLSIMRAFSWEHRNYKISIDEIAGSQWLAKACGK